MYPRGLSAGCSASSWRSYPHPRPVASRVLPNRLVRHGAPGELHLYTPCFLGVFPLVKTDLKAQSYRGQETLASIHRRRFRVRMRPLSTGRLLGRLEQRRRTGAELFQQGRFLGLGGLEMVHLDVAEAPDLFRDRGKTDSKSMVLGRKAVENFRQQRLVVADELALGLALLRVAERIERRATQALHARQQLERAEDPGTECHLARFAGAGIAARQQRRREMNVEA